MAGPAAMAWLRELPRSCRSEPKGNTEVWVWGGTSRARARIRFQLCDFLLVMLCTVENAHFRKARLLRVLRKRLQVDLRCPGGGRAEKDDQDEGDAGRFPKPGRGGNTNVGFVRLVSCPVS